MPPALRLHVLSVAAWIVLAICIARLGYLQVWRQGYYQAVAENQRKQASELAPNRGGVYLQEQQTNELFPVAVNTKKWIAYAVPREIAEPQRIAEELAPALNAFQQRQQERLQRVAAATGQQVRANRAEENPESAPAPDIPAEEQISAITEQLYAKLNRRTDPYEPLLKFYETLDDEFRTFLEEKKLPGIVVQEQTVRTYPEKQLAAHVLGYVGWEDEQQVGRYGIEGYFEQQLRGSRGFFAGERDAQGKLIGVSAQTLEPAQDGTDLILTIDRVVQSIIEEELSKGVERYGAERGTVIVMDPNTGAVKGMATYPSYDPNYYYAIAAADVQRNPAVSELFEPGSILKPVIMAAAIDTGTVTPETTMVDSGPVRVDKYTINTFDGKHHGVQTMTQVLEQSNNIGMVWVAQKLGEEIMYDYLRRFGIGEKTGIELEGEIQSMLPRPSNWNVATLATTSYGQGIAVTPLQALNAINAIANGGLLPQPHVVAATRQADSTLTNVRPETVRRVIAPATAADVAAMMVSVIENGVGALARVPGYYLAGKTGTAQVPDETGGYAPDKKIISFTGFGPLSSPKFSVLIKLDNPAGLSFASGTAAPMFHNIAEKLLNFYQIPPDYDAAAPPPRFSVDTGTAG